MFRGSQVIIRLKCICVQGIKEIYKLLFRIEISLFMFFLLTYSRVQSPSWEANWFPASQEIPRISRTHNRPPIQSIYPYSTSWRSSLILSTHLRLGLPSGLFPPASPPRPYTPPLSSPIHATCPAHLILLDFITRTILGEEYRSFIASLCNFLQSPVTSSLLGPNIFLNTMFSNNLSLCFLYCNKNMAWIDNLLDNVLF